jgi:hypothetical protein
MRRSILVLVYFLVGCATMPPLEVWAQNHPPASEALAIWVRNHAPAAAWMFEWDGNQPWKSRELVEWALGHPGESVPIFVSQHPGWPEFDEFAMTHVPAVHTFLEWCRQYPEAARTLVAHSGGLRWAGYHLYAAEWHMMNPGN